jgi:hypothetical protein
MTSRHIMAMVLAALVALGAASPAWAEEPEGGGTLPPLEERIERLTRAAGDAGDGAAGEDLALPDPPAGANLSAETDAAYQQALRAYYAYRETGYAHRLDVFAWQAFSSKIIFVVVIVLVFAGIYFAAIQFHTGLRRSQGTEQTAKDEPEATEFVFSLSEFKVKSPVLGVIVLTISLAFFYLYLVYVYPIVNVF